MQLLMYSEIKAGQSDLSSYIFCVQYASEGQGTVCHSKYIFFIHPIFPLPLYNKLNSFCVGLCAVNQEQLETKQSITKLSEEVNETNTSNQNKSNYIQHKYKHAFPGFTSV